MGGLIIKALLFGVHIAAFDFWKLSYCDSSLDDFAAVLQTSHELVKRVSLSWSDIRCYS